MNIEVESSLNSAFIIKIAAKPHIGIMKKGRPTNMYYVSVLFGYVNILTPSAI